MLRTSPAAWNEIFRPETSGIKTAADEISGTGIGDFCLTDIRVPSDFAGKSGVLQVIDDSGYAGWVSLEYVPEGPTEEGFGLFRELGLLGN